jgi:hypothetical protein
MLNSIKKTIGQNGQFFPPFELCGGRNETDIQGYEDYTTD